MRVGNNVVKQLCLIEFRKSESKILYHFIIDFYVSQSIQWNYSDNICFCGFICR